MYMYSYSVKVFFIGGIGWKDYGTASYNKLTDKVEFSYDRELLPEIYLPRIQIIQFDKI